MTHEKAEAIVAECFAGWGLQERPIINPEGNLNNGRHWEKAAQTEDDLRRQCAARIKSFE